TKAIARAGGCGGCDRSVESQQVGWRRAGEVQVRYAGEQNRHQIGTTCDGDWRERAAVEQVLEARHLGSLVKPLELRVILRVRAVPAILEAQRNNDFVDQRLAQSRHL